MTTASAPSPALWHPLNCDPFLLSRSGNACTLISLAPLRAPCGAMCTSWFVSTLSSMWTEIGALPDKRAATVAAWFKEAVLYRHGKPQLVVSDQGREFAGEFGDLLKLWGIPTSHSASYHPQANGQAERRVQTICRAITTSTSVDALWDAELLSIVQGYNASFHSSIRMTPSEVMYGRKCMVPCLSGTGSLLARMWCRSLLRPRGVTS